MAIEITGDFKIKQGRHIFQILFDYQYVEYTTVRRNIPEGEQLYWLLAWLQSRD